MSLQDAINTGVGGKALDWTNIRLKSLALDGDLDITGNVIIAGDLSAINGDFTGTLTANDVEATNVNTATFSTTGTSNFNGDVNFFAGNNFDNQMDSTYLGVSNFNNNVNFNQTGYIDVPVFKGGLIMGDHAANPSYLFYGYERKSHIFAAGAQTGCTINGAAYTAFVERIGNHVSITLDAGVGSSLTKNGTNKLFRLNFTSAAIYDLLQGFLTTSCSVCSFDIVAGSPIITSVCVETLAPNGVIFDFTSSIDITDALVFHNTAFSHTFTIYAPLSAPAP